jgi:hypothetical protein
MQKNPSIVYLKIGKNSAKNNGNIIITINAIIITIIVFGSPI